MHEYAFDYTLSEGGNWHTAIFDGTKEELIDECETKSNWVEKNVTRLEYIKTDIQGAPNTEIYVFAVKIGNFIWDSHLRQWKICHCDTMYDKYPKYVKEQYQKQDTKQPPIQELPKEHCQKSQNLQFGIAKYPNVTDTKAGLVGVNDHTSKSTILANTWWNGEGFTLTIANEDCDNVKFNADITWQQWEAIKLLIEALTKEDTE